MLSFEDLRRKLDEAVSQKFGKADGSDAWKYYVIETFDDYVVARGSEDKLFQIAYSVNVNDEVELGEPVEVEEIYVPVTQAAQFAVAADGATADELSFPVVVMKAGFSKSSAKVGKKVLPLYFGADVVTEVAAALDGTRFGRRHPLAGENEAAQPELVAGWFDGGHMEGDEARATLHLLESEKDLQVKLAAAKKANKLDLFGLSVLAYFAFKPGVVDGQECLIATKLAKLARVDWCAEPAAGGRFLQVAASAQTSAQISDLQRRSIKPSSAQAEGNNGAASHAGRNKGVVMKPQILQLLAALSKNNQARAAELTTEFNALSEDKYGEFIVKISQATIEVADAAVASAGTGDAARTALATATQLLEDSKKIQTTGLVQTKLAAAKLPVPAADLVRDRFTGKVATAEEIDAEIVKVRAAFAAFNTAGRVNSEVRVGLETVDKVQLAMDGMCGVKPEGTERVAAFRGPMDAYKFITGDTDLSFGRNGIGGFTRISQAVGTADFANLLLNSMTKALIQDYKEQGTDGIEALYNVVSLNDFKSQDRVRWGYLSDLAAVAENAPYVEMAKPTDEKISYAPTKRGGLVTISRETILNDDLRAIVGYPQRISRAARRTFKRFVTSFFINNPAYDADALAWFHATHANLGVAELGIDELVLREIALGKQTEKDSGERIELDLNWIMVAIDRLAAAKKINRAEFYNPGVGIQEPNPFYQRFGANDERIIMNRLLTDPNDWYYGADKAQAPFLEVGFVLGAQEPQLFINNDPSNGSVGFTNDQIQYKARHEYGGDVVDFRPVGKNVVP